MDPLTIAILGGLIAGLGVSAAIAFARRSTRIMAALKRYFLGLEFLVIGHEHAGKTSFYNYLIFDKLADEYPVRPTRTVSPKFSFDVDKGGKLQLRVASAFDIPGELEPSVQVEIIKKRLPGALLIFLSMDNLEFVEWLQIFLSELKRMLAVDLQLAKKLKSLTIVINKTDMYNDVEKQKALQSVNETVNNVLESILGKNKNLVEVVACTLIRNKNGEKAANEVLLAVIESYHNTKRLVPK